MLIRLNNVSEQKLQRIQDQLSPLTRLQHPLPGATGLPLVHLIHQTLVVLVVLVVLVCVSLFGLSCSL